MITFSSLGKKGNLGNQLFQVASTIGLADKNNHSYRFPQWKSAKFFEFDFPMGDMKGFKMLYEKHFHYYDWEIKNGDYDLVGYLQSEKYFLKDFTKKIFTIKPEVHASVRQKQKLYGDASNILISVRRGDFVFHPWFYQLSYKYYLGALFSNFPDWENRNLFFCSDDIDYCKYHFSFLPNVTFLENLSPIEQLAFATSCNDFIISNSTFSWWLAWLGEKEGSKIIRPLKNFRGEHAKKINENDYFPDRWTIFDHRSYTIPAKYGLIFLKGEIFNSIIFIKFLSSKTHAIIKKLKRKIKF